MSRYTLLAQKLGSNEKAASLPVGGLERDGEIAWASHIGGSKNRHTHRFELPFEEARARRFREFFLRVCAKGHDRGVDDETMASYIEGLVDDVAKRVPFKTQGGPMELYKLKQGVPYGIVSFRDDQEAQHVIYGLRDRHVLTYYGEPTIYHVENILRRFNGGYIVPLQR